MPELVKRLKEHVQILAGDIGPRNLATSFDGLNSAANYIEYVFKSIGYSPLNQEFKVETTDSILKLTSGGVSVRTVSRIARNIIAQTPEKAETIIIGAHYDSVHDCPAANDNASGVAVLLEIARMLIVSSALSKQIRFVAFTNEEPPFFRTPDMGSYRYAQYCHESGAKISGMYCLETVGCYTQEPNSQKSPTPFLEFMLPTVGNFVLFVSNWSSRNLMNSTVKGFVKSCSLPAKKVILPEKFAQVSFSDHHSFWSFGIPAVMITDTAHYRYSHYHEVTDTPDRLNYEALAELVLGLSSALNSN